MTITVNCGHTTFVSTMYERERPTCIFGIIETKSCLLKFIKHLPKTVTHLIDDNAVTRLRTTSLLSMKCE